MIHFECPSCASPFEVDDRLAGRAGRCKNCGGRMKIPSNGAVAAPAAARQAQGRGGSGRGAGGPAADPDGGIGRLQAQPSMAAGRPTNWLEAVTSQVGLAPISMQDMKRLPGSKSAWADEKSIAGPYKLAAAPSLPAMRAGEARPRGPSPADIAGAWARSRSSFAGSTRAPTSSPSRS